MYFQKVIKGIKGIDHDTAQNLVDEGIVCNRWRKTGEITVAEKKALLTMQNLDLHLNHYHKPVPTGHMLELFGVPFGEVSPFISTSAGTIERDPKAGRNIPFPPFMTAIRFATDNFRTTGYIFYAYLLTLGKAAVELEQFSEETRELHIYQDYQPYHKQGEIMAKIIIPSVQIEMACEYGPVAGAVIKSGGVPVATDIIMNASYLPPDKYSNIREVIK